MLKNISNLGSLLNKTQQKDVFGGKAFASGSGFCKCISNVVAAESTQPSADACEKFCTGAQGYIFVGA